MSVCSVFNLSGVLLFSTLVLNCIELYTFTFRFKKTIPKSLFDKQFDYAKFDEIAKMHFDLKASNRKALIKDKYTVKNTDLCEQAA